jgi:hypothetical protein
MNRTVFSSWFPISFDETFHPALPAKSCFYGSSFLTFPELQNLILGTLHPAILEWVWKECIRDTSSFVPVDPYGFPTGEMSRLRLHEQAHEIV